MQCLLRALRGVALAGCGVLLAAGAAANAASTLTLSLAQAIELPAPTAVPPKTGEFQAVALPDQWTDADRRVTWYRFEFESPAVPPGTLLAAYLPRVCSNVEVQLNGQLVHRAGRMTEPVKRNCYQSQLITLPSALLKGTRNRLDVQVAGYGLPLVSARQRAGGMSAVMIGPEVDLAALHAQQLFWSITFEQIIAATLVMVGGLLLALAWVRRVGYLGYFGAVAIGWAAWSTRTWWGDAPLDNGLIELISAATFVPVAVCAVLFVLRYCGIRRRGLELALWSQCLLMPVLLVAAGPPRLFVTTVGCYTLLALQVIAAIAVFLWRSGKRQREGLWLTGGVFAGSAVIAGLELGVQYGLVPMSNVQLMNFAIPFLFCALAFRLIETFARALSAAEAARGELENRVREISAQIERNFSNLAEARVEQVAEKERKRIAADLHDDLGAKLLTIVHTSDDERISNLAREALEEMRLSVRGIAGKPVQLADALADWRAETVSRLGEAGIEVEWSGTESSEPLTLPARTYVQTTRILREATSNLIKHSAASLASVTCTVGEDLQLMIRDNGRGIPMELDGKLDRGHGMASMKQRAKQMQGQCLVESGPGYGTVIRLTLPL